MLKKIGLLIALSVSVFAVHNGEININNTDLEVGLKLDMGQFRETVEPNTMFVGAKYIKPDRAAVYGNTNETLEAYYEVNFLIMKEVGDAGVDFGMGIKVNHTKDFESSPLGMEIAYKLPVTDSVPMKINALVYYAPQVLTYSDGASYLEYRVSFDAELIENSFITIGYRSITPTYIDNVIGTNSEVFNYNSSLYFGFKLGF